MSGAVGKKEYSIAPEAKVNLNNFPQLDSHRNRVEFTL
jgi:hypothetical protein